MGANTPLGAYHGGVVDQMMVAVNADPAPLEEKEMFKRQLRSILTIVVAASSIAAATGPIAPAFAQKNTGGYSRSVEAKHKAIDCANLQTLANSDSDTASTAYGAGNNAKGDEYSRYADQDYQMAQKRGCSWAQ